MAETDNSWMPPEGYYEQLAVKRANPFLHKAAILTTASAFLPRHGKPEIFAPKSVLELEGGAIIVPTHRSALDTIVVPHCLESIGIHHARPVAKEGLFKFKPLASLMHNLGAIGVNRKKPDIEGLVMTQEPTLNEGGSIINFAEGERIHQNTLKVAKLKGFVGSTAVTSRRPIIPLGIAGFSKEINAQEEVIAKDKMTPFGIGPPVVAYFGEPIYADVLDPELELSKRELRKWQIGATRDVMQQLKTSLQNCLDEAYAIRGSALEKIPHFYGDGSDRY